MLSSDYPILEFDENKEALIRPEFLKNRYEPISERLLICFFHETIEKLLEREEIALHFVLRGENPLKIYKFQDQDMTLVEGRLGAPAAGGYLEDLIALGAKKILFVGGAGVLRKDLAVGKFLVPTSAVRDEGFSYHYLPPAREVEANLDVASKITEYLKKSGIDYLTGKTWTTDAFYRETPEKIKKRREEGCLFVEMEQSALMAVAAYREVEYGAILYGGDDVSKEKWDSRNWRDRGDIRVGLTELAKEILLVL